MRRLLAGLLTTAVVGLMAWSALKGPVGGRDEAGGSDGPRDAGLQDAVVAIAPGRVAEGPLDGAEARVRDLLATAKRGDVAAYLASFDDPLRGRLEREVAERGPDAFSRRLREAAGARKGHAVFAPEPDGPDGARVTVESVYLDHNERQTFLLRRNAGRWLVAEVEAVRPRQPGAQFGSPATFEAPEAPPVMATPGA